MGGRHTYIPGRAVNLRGPRATVTEPDEAAVERLLAGDRTLVVAKVEREAAMDYVDRAWTSSREVAIRLGVSQRTVVRRRHERRRLRLLSALVEERFGPLTPEVEQEVAAEPLPHPLTVPIRRPAATEHQQHLLDALPMASAGSGRSPR